MKEGENAVLDALRTPTLYPVRFNARQLARCVVDLFNSDDPQPMEIFINEKDLLGQQEEDLADESEETTEEDAEELDDVIGEDSGEKTGKTSKRQKQAT